MGSATLLVFQVLKENKIRLLEDMYSGSIVVPIIRRDEGGGIKNCLPCAYARFLKDYGFEVEKRILQINSTAHTDSSLIHRLKTRSYFRGPVIAKHDYILVDDHVTSGGTLNDLRKYITLHEGNVVAISTLSASRGSVYIAIRETTKDKIYLKFGARIDDLLRLTGISYNVSSLTEVEGLYLLKLQPQNLEKYLLI